MQKENKVLNTIIIAIVSIIITIFVAYNIEKEAKFNEKYENTFTSKHKIDTDEYLLDSISFAHPTWDYDRVKDYVFLNSDSYEIKYKENK